MAKAYSYTPESIDRKSFFFKTPGIGELRHSLIVRQFVQERIRCFMDDIPFSDTSLAELARRFMVIPGHYETDEQRLGYFTSELKEVMAAFKLYEEGAGYREDIRLLRPYRGHRWVLRSTSPAGILIIIEV